MSTKKREFSCLSNIFTVLSKFTGIHSTHFHCIRIIKSAKSIFCRTGHRVTHMLFKFVCPRDRSSSTESSKMISSFNHRQSIMMFKGVFLLRMNEAQSHLHLSHQFISPPNAQDMSWTKSFLPQVSQVLCSTQHALFFADNFTAITKRYKRGLCHFLCC